MKYKFYQNYEINRVLILGKLLIKMQIINEFL